VMFGTVVELLSGTARIEVQPMGASLANAQKAGDYSPRANVA